MVKDGLHIYSVLVKLLLFDSFRLPPKAGVLNVLEKWHVAFHGTSVAHIRKILDTGDLILPGETALTRLGVFDSQVHNTGRCIWFPFVWLN